VSRARGLPASLATAVVAAAGLCAACNSARTTDEPAPAASTVPVKAPELPADHLAPGELLEGSEQMFGITLPRGMKVDATFAKLAFASGPVALHPLVDYLRAHVQNGGLREGEGSATFEHVTAPGKPQPELQIHVVVLREVVKVVFTDPTPDTVVPPLPDNESRMKHAGLAPSGRILDPTHLD
jgi:hypothetical protein